MIIGALGTLGPDDRIVDLGCGEGDLLAELHDRFPDVELLGVDISSEGIARAEALVPSARFLRADLVSGEGVGTDYVEWANHAVCSEVLEHLDEPERFLRAAAAIAAPGTEFIVTVPGGPMSSFDRFIGHRRHFTARDLRSLLSSAGFEVESLRRVGFPFFNLYRLLVIVRSDALIRDATTKGSAAISLPARVVLGAFGLLFRFNVSAVPFGWQLVARATPKPST
jgi:SAM-dependent methyltransferase